MYWKRLTKEQIKESVFSALNKNISYSTSKIMGVPGSSLDANVFNREAANGEAYLSAMVENANHIGCHTLDNESEAYFKGTQDLEIESINICAEKIFNGKADMQDGYVATGSTEANIEAMWIYRNYFNQVYNARNSEIGVLFSADSHVSIAKGCDLLELRPFIIDVDYETREPQEASMNKQVRLAIDKGVRYFIVIVNMGTHMFGSVDNVDMYTKLLEDQDTIYKVHVDASFGGFVYPFTNPFNELSFANRKVSSICLDAYRSLRAPYGTSIFLIRKGYIGYAITEEARYVSGKDFTICGSRSGANAVAFWMLLMAYGSKGIKNKMNRILERTDQLCLELDKRNIEYYRNPYMNILAIKNKYINRHIEDHYGLVPDVAENPHWWRIVVSAHVNNELIDRFLAY